MADPQEITDRLLHLEDRGDFFDVTVAGAPVWERCRSDVHRALLKELTDRNRAHSPSPSSQSTVARYKDTLSSLLKSSLRRNPFFTRRRDVLVYGHSRRKLLDDGYWWDLYFDPLYEEIELDYVHIEKSYMGGHKSPPKTGNLRNRDFINSLAMIWKKTGLGLADLSQADLEKLRELDRTIEDEFGVDLTIDGRVRHQILLREPLRRLYRRLLSRVDPELALLVVSYGREPFIEACKEMDVPVVELQHGIIHDRHFGYHYPGSRTKASFPDYLLTWGDFWSDAAEYPIPDDHVISVGYPYLERRREHYADVERKNQLLFLSQGTVGEQLSKFALEVHRHPSIDHDVVYKLHPGEYDRWRREYPWLRDSNLTVVDSSSPPLYELFAESSAQIGVGSTAVFEGLSFDLETFVYDLPAAEILLPLVEAGSARLISSADDLARHLDSSAPRFDQDVFFEPDSIQKMADEIRRIAGSH